MALNFYSSINLNQNELQFPVIHSAGSAPSSPAAVAGQLYFNSGNAKALYVYDGSNWLTVGQNSISTLAVETTIASGDKMAFSDENQTGDINNAITIDNLATFLAGGTGLSASSGAIGLANIADDTILGNVSGGSAAPSAMSAGALRTLIGTGNSGLVPSAGTSGHFLKHDGTFGIPAYVANTNTNQLTTFSIRDDDNDSKTIAHGKYVKFIAATGTAGTNWSGSGTTGDPWIMTITSPDTTTDTQLSTEQVQDIAAGQIVTNGSHSGISFAYDDAGDGAIDATIATLNQNTTGSAATLTTARTIGGVSFNGSASINLPGVNATGNQNTSGTAAGLTGTPNVTVGTIASGNITTTGYLRGPATFTIDPVAHGDNTGKVVIAGDLQVDGTTTTINSTTVSIDDLNFTIASDAGSSSAANGAGITIGGASATLLYTHATTSWDMNKPLNVTGNIGVTGTVDGIDIATDVAANTAKATNVSTNLGITGTSAARVITSSDGTNATIPVATTSVSGVMSATQVTTLNATQTSGNVDTLIKAKTVVALIDHDDSTFLAGNMTATITHGFGTADVLVELYDVVTEATVHADVYRTAANLSDASTSVISIDFGTAPPNDIRCLITNLDGATVGSIAYA